MTTQSSSDQSATGRKCRWAGNGCSLVAIVALLLIPCGGCGTSQYEQRMDQQSSQLRQRARSAPKKEAVSRRRGGDPADEFGP